MEQLSDYGIHVKASSGNTKTTCPQCSAQRKKQNDPCLSVDIDRGLFQCHNCGWKGGIKEDKEPMQTPPPDKLKPALNTQPLTPDAVAWVKNRGIGDETMNRLNYKSCTFWFPQLQREGPAVAIPFYQEGKCVNVKIRSIESKAFAQIKGGKQVLYNYHECKSHSTLALTEGEMDAAAIIEAGWQGGVCSCPNGAPAENTENLDNKLAFIDDAKDIFDKADSVILATDADKPGVQWAEALAEKIGPEKCYTVEWSSECKDANDVLLAWGPKALRECLDYARPYPVPGIVEINDCEQEIIDYFRNGGASAGYSTGWRTIDELTHIDTKTLNILTGIPSSGKSEWLDQLMLHTVRHHGWKWAVYSPENYPISHHVQKLAEKWLGKPMFDRYAISSMTMKELYDAKDALNDSCKMLTFDEKPATLDDLITRLKVCKRRWGIKGVIIDPYNELDHSRPPNQTESEYISDMLSTLRNFARLYDVAVWIVAHPTKLQKREDGQYPVPTPYDISGSAHWRNKGDICISAWRKMGEDVAPGAYIYIQKVRSKNLGQTGHRFLHWKRANGVFYEEIGISDEDVPETF